MKASVRAPIAFIVFNRTETTRRVFERIRAAKPARLLIIADGPRVTHPNEREACGEVRRIAEAIDWPCELLKNYAETNLGCGVRVATGLDWVFQNVDEAIILEDDCLPDASFFRFCDELLERYRAAEQVMQICGSNFLFDRIQLSRSYYFSRYPLCWGWATWRRAWHKFDFEMSGWKAYRQKYLGQFTNRAECAFWQTNWDNVCDGILDTWDYQWFFSHFDADGRTIVPRNNLVTNIGFGKDATHTRSRALAPRPATRSVTFPLVHPPTIERNLEADNYTAHRLFLKRTALGKVAEAAKRSVLGLASRMRARRASANFVTLGPSNLCE